MVPNTSEDLPDPETPVNTVSRRLGISTLMSFRLFTRAPWTRIRSWLSAGCSLEDVITLLSLEFPHVVLITSGTDNTLTGAKLSAFFTQLIAPRHDHARFTGSQSIFGDQCIPVPVTAGALVYAHDRLATIRDTIERELYGLIRTGESGRAVKSRIVMLDPHHRTHDGCGVRAQDAR